MQDPNSKAALNPQKTPKLENIANFIVIFPKMKENYHRYPDLLFIDTSVKHKIPILGAQNTYKGYGSTATHHS